jgi:hypothetical protein
MTCHRRSPVVTHAGGDRFGLPNPFICFLVGSLSNKKPGNYFYTVGDRVLKDVVYYNVTVPPLGAVTLCPFGALILWYTVYQGIIFYQSLTVVYRWFARPYGLN